MEFESSLVSWMNLQPVILSEVSQRERGKNKYINAYMWNLEKMLLMNLFARQA